MSRLTVAGLLAGYREQRLRPTAVMQELLDAIAREAEPIWISRVPDHELLDAAAALEREAAPSLPLYGVPFAVKDNIDVEGMATTAAYPGLSHPVAQTAAVVQRLRAAGALLVGKTNMDQFATGLVGTRSPYGALSAVSDRDRVSGGSSSGSAVAVARGLVAFSLGTDTAGSGRVPAAFNGLVGCKPTLGLLSTRGVLPACASLDCVSIFAATVNDAATVLKVAAGYEELDPWSRPAQAPTRPRTGVIGLPRAAQIEFDEAAAARAWVAARERAGGHWKLVEVDIEPLLQVVPLLYDIWVAERTESLGRLLHAGDGGLDPTVAEIIARGRERTAVEVFAASHRLAELRREAGPLWDGIDALLLPTTPLHPTHAEVTAAPFAVNERLGRYTNFVNLMDLAGLAIPGPARDDGLPFGVSLLAPAWSDQRLLELGAEWTGEPGVDVGGLAGAQQMTLAVAGAHMSGLPLSSQLTGQGARPLGFELTAPRYRFYELPGGTVRRPGLIRVDERGVAIEVELWEISPQALGRLVGTVPPPLAIGTVELADGRQVKGFVCEGYAAADAIDITDYGGWRAYLGALGAP